MTELVCFVWWVKYGKGAKKKYDGEERSGKRDSDGQRQGLFLSDMAHVGPLLNVRYSSNQFFLVSMPVGLHRQRGFNS